MSRDCISRYVWIIDTIRRYGRITRRQLYECWQRSPYANCNKMTRRTFYGYRDAIEQLFNLRIEFDTSTFEYYIESDDENTQSTANWLLNSFSLQKTLITSRHLSHRIIVEDVPSAREYLGMAIEALNTNNQLRFTYLPYTRTLPYTVEIEPYFIRLFKQRWYIIGMNVDEQRLKTYAFDRIRAMTTLQETFTVPDDFDAEIYYKDSYGIVVTQSEVRKVVIKTGTKQAKYLAALPLHRSQQQTISDSFSLFTYHLRITDDFVEELLSHGSSITVLEPIELRTRIRQELAATLANYEDE